MARSACARSRRPAASCWCRTPARPSTPRCPAAPSPRGSPTSCCRCASLPSGSSSCCTGAGAYTTASLRLEEAVGPRIRPTLQVFGSDLDARSLAIARDGRYPAAIEADVGEERLRRFFVREGDHYRVRRELRDIVL